MRMDKEIIQQKQSCVISLAQYIRIRMGFIDVNIGTIVGPGFKLTPNLENFTQTFLILIPNFWNVPIEKEIKYKSITSTFKILNQN